MPQPSAPPATCVSEALEPRRLLAAGVVGASYFDNADFTGTVVRRNDAAVNFSWTGLPVAGIGADTFSVRWSGLVQAQYSQTYTFYTHSDDGVRLWVDGRKLIDNWTPHGLTENSASIALQAGRKYDLRMEFFDNAGTATAKLLWSSSSTPKQIVPGARMSSYDVRFASVGDYGNDSTGEADVARRIKSWDPEFVVTTGDNDYSNGGYDRTVGKYYHDFIAPYTGAYGAGSPGGVNRFFPSLGNHDWDPGVGLYLNYFTLPTASSGNERYYEFTRGPVRFFVLDSDPREPHGISATSTQANWLRPRLSASTSPWNVVILHHPPYSSGPNGSYGTLQWPFAQWGADVVMAGHDHVYERIARDGIYYFVNGIGGAEKHAFRSTFVSGSQARYNADYGAMLIQATSDTITYQFLNRGGTVIDSLTVKPTTPPDTLVAKGSTWRYLDNGSNQGTAWRATSFSDSAWRLGRGQLGYGDGDEATVVSYGPNAAAKHVTTYFRRLFNVTSPSAYANLSLDVMRDDGVVVYVNGVEVGRRNMPTGTVTYTTLASANIGGADESAYQRIVVGSSRLVAGNNVVAVELHQATRDSTDISFDLQLLGNRWQSVAVPNAKPPVTGRAPGPAYGSGESSGAWARLDDDDGGRLDGDES